jgi:TP901-1 family phage major tail protein
MAARAGKIWAMYVFDGSSYIKVAGVRSQSLSVSNNEVDITTADSVGRWKEFLGEASVVEMTLNVSGIFQSEAAAKRLLAAAISGAAETVRLSTPGIQIDGQFTISNFNQEAPYDNAATFTAALKASGAPVFTYS